MADRAAPAGYSGLQIALHWLIAGMVVFLVLFGESMKEFMDASREGTPPGAGDSILADAHYWVGLAVLALAAVRVALRAKQGRLARRAGEGSLAERVATAMHVLFYVLLFVVPATGLLAYYVSGGFGEIHEIGKPVFIVTILVHAAAALVHQFWMKDGTLKRMIVPAR
jgi:cytochrome b561